MRLTSRRLEKKSETALSGLEKSDVSFVRRSSRNLLIIANNLTSDFFMQNPIYELFLKCYTISIPRNYPF